MLCFFDLYIKNMNVFSKQNNPESEENTFFSDQEQEKQDFSMIPPETLWQRFWRNTVLRIVVGGFILIGIGIAIIGFVMGPWQSKSTILTDYVPASAWLYLEFDLDPTEWNQLYEQRPHLTERINNFFIEQGLSQGVINTASKLALVGLVEDNQIIWGWVVQTPQPRQLETFILPGTFLKQPGNNIAVISTNEKFVSQFSFRPGRAPSVTNRNSLWHGFIRLENILSIAQPSSEKNIYEYVLSYMVKRNLNELPIDIFWESGVLKITTNALSEIPVIWPSESRQSRIALTSTSAEGSLANFESIIAQLPLADYYWNEFKEKTVVDYGVNWHVLSQIIQRPTAILANLSFDEKSSDSLEETLVATNVSSFSAYLSGTANESERVFINNVINAILARHNPVERKVELADGSQMYDLIVDPSQVIQENISDTETIFSIPNISVATLYNNEGIGIRIGDSQSDLNKSGIEEMHCGLEDADSLYASGEVLKQAAWLIDYDEMLISYSSGFLSICLR